ncbi:ribonuclease D [Pararhizobium mangrovi]|uniref:Ribonuclease D n=1 Tax=Pararhizobium mangrovi TaxID=2590452 RepID=A0A506UG37_9HYPH|nr:ribonuclease D [Pararhizobium mangrovi]TPW32095.1 ribonuclease D [Pararhizobium mangrovi]
MITTTEALASACRDLARSDFVTVDTEFIRETTYWPELCLIQMAAPDMAVLVDPLAPDIDLAPFFALMGDETTVKVFHAARQDVEIIFHRADMIPHPTFDTQVAAMVCGFGDSISYDQLVKRTVGEQLDKTSRFTDWRRRPLSDMQLEYALADVTHLRDVYLHLSAELEREGRAHWLNEEMAILESRETYYTRPEDAWKRLKMRVRKPIELAIMQALADWREREARERNVPRGRVIKDDGIYEIAQQKPASAEAMTRLRSVSRGFERSQQGQAIVALVQDALDKPKEDLPKLPRQRSAPEGSAAAIDLLKVLLKLVAEKHAVATKIVASGDDLEQIAVSGEDADVPALKGWRRELFGEPALDLIAGRTALRFVDRRIEAVAL